MNDLTAQHEDLTDEAADDDVSARREFLKKCGKYAVVVPPAMALLLTRGANAQQICFVGSPPICLPAGEPNGE